MRHANNPDIYTAASATARCRAVGILFSKELSRRLYRARDAKVSVNLVAIPDAQSLSSLFASKVTEEAGIIERVVNALVSSDAVEKVDGQCSSLSLTRRSDVMQDKLWNWSLTALHHKGFEVQDFCI
jgi:hypothetical protein